MSREHPWSHALDRIALPAMVLSVVAVFTVIGLFFGLYVSPAFGLLAVGIAVGAWVGLLVVRAGIGLASSPDASFGAGMLRVAHRDSRTTFNYAFVIGWIALCVEAAPVALAVLGAIIVLAIGYVVVGLKSNKSADADAPEAPPTERPPDDAQ